MPEIIIYGAGDDCVEVEGCEGDGEFCVTSTGRWQGDLIAPGGASMRVRAAFDPDGSGCWAICLSKPDESIPFPAWGNGTEEAPIGYSTLIRIDAPPGTRLANVLPDPDSN